MGSDDDHHCGIRSQPKVAPVIQCVAGTQLLLRRTFLGKFIGGLCALSGIFILTLPIPIVVNSFGNFYKNRLWRNEVELKKKERMRLRSLKNIQNQKQQFIKVITRYHFLSIN